METQNTPVGQTQKREKFFRPGGRSLGGVVLVIVGTLLLLRRMDVDLPYWLFSWEMIPIGIGLYIGARQSFRLGGWLIPVFIGLAFLLQSEILDYDMRRMFWPVVIISIGVFMIFRPRRTRMEKEFIAGSSTEDTDSGDFIDSSVLFGGIQRNIISKDFKGGTIDNMFGGTDLNMMQADFKGTVVLNFNIAFGGAKMVVPPQWNVRNEITAILGGVEDKRPVVPNTEPGKVLVLKGTVMFGGVEIKSH